jgi:hypothetical protein
MGAGQSTSPEKTIARAAATLGLADADALLKLPRKDFARFTQKQLFECTKQLGLKGTSKLSKDQLTERILEEINGLQAPKPVAKPSKAEKATKGKGEPGEDVTRLSHKFELGARGKVEEPNTIPWSYGYDRVTGMAVDPERLFVYWDVSDDSIARARAGLGSGGQDAWLSLRIYDTTGRIFDGTNAHSYFDHGLDRSDRQWFFHVGKPASSAFVDIGMKSREGFFVKIARSGRIDFPRREQVAWVDPEWLSVRSVWGPVEHAGRGAYVKPYTPPAAGPGGTAGGEGPHPAPRRHVALLPWEEIIQMGEGGRVEVTEWEQHFSEGGTELHRHMTWESPVMISAWEAGPFTHPVEAPEPTREQFVGPTRVFRVGGRTHVVHGPWQVVIRGIGAHYGRAVVARWEIFRSWITEGSLGAEGTRRETRIPGSSEIMVGASEKRWRQGSEARLGGASEIYFLGASEVLARGASERLFMGASQYMLRGASERVVGGGSEVRMRGASERMLGGASERLGASERRLGGASERLGGSENRLGGASEVRLGGGSEPRLGGGSEIRLAGPMPPDSGYPSPDSISGSSKEGKE